MLCLKVCVIFVLLVAAVFADEESNVVQLTKDSFGGAIGSAPHFVKFYAPW